MSPGVPVFSLQKSPHLTLEASWQSDAGAPLFFEAGASMFTASASAGLATPSLLSRRALKTIFFLPDTFYPQICPISSSFLTSEFLTSFNFIIKKHLFFVLLPPLSLYIIISFLLVFSKFPHFILSSYHHLIWKSSKSTCSSSSSSSSSPPPSSAAASQTPRPPLSIGASFSIAHAHADGWPRVFVQSLFWSI